MERHIVQHFAAATVLQAYSVQPDHAKNSCALSSRGLITLIHRAEEEEINGHDYGGLMGLLGKPAARAAFQVD